MNTDRSTQWTMSRSGISQPTLACRLVLLSAFTVLPVLSLGCETKESTTSSMRVEQDKAMRDPFSYGPTAADLAKPVGEYDKVDPTNITGGGTSTLDKKALKRDLDAVFNP